jgi:hypothetical protein
MSEPGKHSLPGNVPEGDPFQTIEGLKQAGLRVGCFGCMLSGWSLVLVAAGLVVFIYFLWP